MLEILKTIIYEPWPWYVGGPLIGITVLSLLKFEQKQLGISSSFQYICGKISPIEFDYFKNTQNVKWQMFFVIGLMLGGLINYLLIPNYIIPISTETVSLLKGYGIEQQTGFVPKELYIFSIEKMSFLLLGGVLLGFGARYANGCTAGHAIMGFSQLAPSSILSTISFFVGGLIATYFLLPYIF